MLLAKSKIPYAFFLFSLLIMVGCKTFLAPVYDKAIVDSVATNSEKTMSFLASVDQGTSNTNFADREDSYNELIGAYDALKIQTKARPIPTNTAIKKINEILQSKGTETISGEYPSAVAFEKISETLKKMKTADKSNGLKPVAVQAFKGQIEVFLDQAITYESFLKR